MCFVCVVRDRLQNMKKRGFWCMLGKKNVFTVSASESGSMTAAEFISLHKLHFTFCVWPLILRSDVGCGSNPPGCVLQSAADFVHLLFPKIDHCQMDPAVLTHTDFPVRTQKHI